MHTTTFWIYLTPITIYCIPLVQMFIINECIARRKILLTKTFLYIWYIFLINPHLLDCYIYDVKVFIYLDSYVSISNNWVYFYWLSCHHSCLFFSSSSYQNNSKLNLFSYDLCISFVSSLFVKCIKKYIFGSLFALEKCLLHSKWTTWNLKVYWK